MFGRDILVMIPSARFSFRRSLNMVIRVAVFRRSDGAVLCDSTFAETNNAQAAPSAKSVWALVQVLLPFARELGGGGVRSVILRDAEVPTDARAFGAPRPRPPMEITVAHGTHVAVTVIAPVRKMPTAKLYCDHLHKFILTSLLRRSNNENEAVINAPNASDGNLERDESFDIRAYMESFVSSGSNSSSFFSSEASSDRSDSEAEFADSTPETPLLEIDTTALGAEVARAMESFL